MKSVRLRTICGTPSEEKTDLQHGSTETKLQSGRWRWKLQALLHSAFDREPVQGLESWSEVIGEARTNDDSCESVLHMLVDWLEFNGTSQLDMSDGCDVVLGRAMDKVIRIDKEWRNKWSINGTTVVKFSRSISKFCGFFIMITTHASMLDVSCTCLQSVRHTGQRLPFWHMYLLVCTRSIITMIPD